MANKTIQSVVDHNLIKIITPLAVFAMMGTLGWLFSTVMDVEKLALENSMNIEHLHMAEDNFEKQMNEVEKIITDIRINMGRLVH